MKIVFRCDASIQMGTGHVMRCLTLADALSQQGAECHFICREHPGHLNALIAQRGYKVHALAHVEQSPPQNSGTTDALAHAHWLGATQEEDSRACKPLIQSIQPDWLIIDHYALDECWQKDMRPFCQKIMVIDDLADRQHDCDLLLDQTFGRDDEDYKPLVPEHCQLLCGAEYALLRPEFAQWRSYSLKRRENGQLEHLLINLGGVDKDNITTQILQALSNAPLPKNCRITVVMGATAPWVKETEEQAAQMPWPTEVKVGVNNMAELMANSDLAIGAAGATSWERCCLGLPTIMIVLAENQKLIASGLEAKGAAVCFNKEQIKQESLAFKVQALSNKPEALKIMSQQAATITEGNGAEIILQHIGLQMTGMQASAVRKMSKSDLKRVLEWRNHPEVRKYMYTQHEISLEEHTKWFDSASNDNARHLLVFEKDKEPLGFINISEVKVGGIADWGFYLSPQAPKGTGKELGKAALDYGFKNASLHKICGQALAFNQRSIAFHLKLGFKQEGILRYQHFDGQNYHDVVCFGLLASEWFAQQRD